MTIPTKSALGAAALCAGALVLSACVYHGPYGDRYRNGWHHDHYYGHDHDNRDRHDRHDEDRDGD